MIDYKKELEEIATFLPTKEYNLIINRTSWLMEQAFKQLVKDQLAYFDTLKETDKDYQEYESFLNIIEENFSHFNINKITMGGLVRFFHLTRMFNLIEERLDVRLTFTKRINWNKIKNIRNKVIHEANFKVQKDRSFDFIHYTKVLIYETKLNKLDPEVDEHRCHNCEMLIDNNWNYCSNCGADLGNYCKKCNSFLKQSWTICPECQTPRSGVKTKKPDLLYNHYCEAVWADGIMTMEERVFLDNKREELGLDKEEAEKIEEYHAPKNAVRFRDSVEATLVDGVIDEQERVFLRNKALELGLSKEMANEIFNACLYKGSDENLFSRTRHKIIQMEHKKAITYENTH